MNGEPVYPISHEASPRLVSARSQVQPISTRRRDLSFSSRLFGMSSGKIRPSPGDGRQDQIRLLFKIWARSLLSRLRQIEHNLLRSKLGIDIVKNGGYTGWSDIRWIAYKLVHDLAQNRKAIEFTASKSCQVTQPLARRNPQLRSKRPSGSSYTDSESEESSFTGK